MECLSDALERLELFGNRLFWYHIKRTIEEKDHQGVGDGAHIIYVNGSFRNQDHPISRLMYDFHCQKATDMLNPVLADEVRKLKETEGGQRYMCKLLEEMREKR
ncbi:MAG: hypothetical protein ACOX8M_09225 [Marvinbryantia sp.]|jgi:hypothetical protein